MINYELSPDFEKFLSFIPEILSRDEIFPKGFGKLYSRCDNPERGLFDSYGRVVQDAYFINKGLFINQYINENGNECVTGFSSDSMYPFVSTIGYFTQVPSEFEVKAIEDGELLCFSRTDIERLSLGYPAFATCYQNVMLMIISKLYSMFAVRQTCKAEEFLKYLYTNHQWIVSRVPDKYIAQYMGVSDSWYCKLKKRILY